MDWNPIANDWALDPGVAGDLGGSRTVEVYLDGDEPQDSHLLYSAVVDAGIISSWTAESAGSPDFELHYTREAYYSILEDPSLFYPLVMQGAIQVGSSVPDQTPCTGLAVAGQLAFGQGPGGHEHTAPLYACPCEVTLSGGTQHLHLVAGEAHGNRIYLVLGSISGISPGLPFDQVVLPLNYDDYMLLTLIQANGPAFVNTLGLLDAAGSASARIEVPSGLNPGLAGLVLEHAYAVLDFPGSGAVVFASNSAPLVIAP